MNIRTSLRALLMLAGAALCIAATSAPAREGSVTAPDAARQRQSFNAGWRFHFGAAPGAEKPAFDDADWQAVGLPHSFSIPYFQAATFPVGEGWYRKNLVVDKPLTGRRLFLEFEGAFQVADVYVNGTKLTQHRGGYTGFPVDITPALHTGRNIVAVRVDNRWQQTLAPRAGEHVFSGGLYRDVWLVQTSDVHVPWAGSFVTTPELSAERGRVAVQTEVRNDGLRDQSVNVLTEVQDAKGTTVATLPPLRLQVPRGQTVNARQLSAPLAQPALWSPETPVLYRAVTRLTVDGRVRDRYETEFGFRWFEWTADRGFFLNGKHHYFRGANVHQDQAGWGDAVTNAAIERDVQLIKDAGFDFIRGSHYPHDPHFATATDRIGLLFLSESPFWGTANFDSDWGASAYPVNPEHHAAFDASVKQQLAEMIRIHRNHPSIVAWSMGNEVFFTAGETMPQVRRLLKEMVELTHALDPSRPAAASGVQRGELDKLGDIAGYNGDGAVLFPNPGVPNFVAEYGSPMVDRPGGYEPGWGDLEKTPGAEPGRIGSWRFPWRSGEVVWTGFDHGSIAGRQFGSMGIVDYARLPKRAWHWYRNAYRGITPPAWPEQGRAAALQLTASAPVIRRADGTDDVQLVVTVVDAAGRPLSNSPPVRLQIEAGPGELPTGREIDFTPDGDIPIRDGQAAIAMRSWQQGVSRLRASSPGLKDATLDIRTLQGPPFVAGVTPLVEKRPYHKPPMVEGREQVLGGDNPTGASSSVPGHASRFINDGDMSTWWAPAANDAEPWVLLDVERIFTASRLIVTLHEPGRYALHAEMQSGDGTWVALADLPMADLPQAKVELPTQALTGRKVRLSARSAAGEPVGVAELRIVGTIKPW